MIVEIAVTFSCVKLCALWGLDSGKKCDRVVVVGTVLCKTTDNI